MEAAAEQVPFSGMVIDADTSLPVTGARLRLHSSESGRSYLEQSDSSGNFAFDVETGSGYWLQVQAQKDYQDYNFRNLQIPTSGLMLSIPLEPAERADISGWMSNSEGMPIPHFTLSLQGKTVAGSRFQVTGDQQGYFSVSDVPLGELKFETLSQPRLSVDAIKAMADQTIQLILDWGDYQIHGRVVDAQGQPVPSAEVSLSWSYRGPDQRSRSQRRTSPDASGRFLFTRLGSGPHGLTVTAPGFATSSMEFEVGAGNNEVVMALD
jgi:hypothetical protein